MRKGFLLILFAIFSKIALAQTPDSSSNSILFNYELNHFDTKTVSDWHTYSLEYKHAFNFGPVIGRLNFGKKFQQHGLQFETEAYPKLGKKIYSYVGAGYSADMPVFPKWRTGASVYLPFSAGWEVEGGFRQLYFDRSIWIGTFGISKYLGNWLLNTKTFIPFDQTTTNVSVFLNARKYLKNQADYFWIQLGRGVSPDENRNIQLRSLSTVTSNRVGGGIKFSVASSIQIQLSTAWIGEKLSPHNIENQLTGTAGVEFRF